MNDDHTDFVPEALSHGEAHQGTLAHTEDEKEAFPDGSKSVLNANDFVFVLGQGSGWHGYNVLKVNTTGKCEYTFGGERTGKWQRAAFLLSAAELTELQAKIVETDLFALAKGYFFNAHDGTQWFVKVQGKSQRKSVYCDNYFPQEIVRLSQFVAERVMAGHKKEIDAAVAIDLKWDEFEKETW